MARGKPWQPGGKSPNPGGRSKKQREIEQLVQGILESGEKNIAIDGLLVIATDMANEPRDRIKAWELLLAYGYGKPRQRIDMAIERMDDEELMRELSAAVEQWREGVAH